MKIKVKSLQGEEYMVDAQNDHSVSDIKALISVQANGPAIERQKLVYKGRTMQDANLVAEYNLEEGCKVHLILQKEDNPIDVSTRLENDNLTTVTSQAKPSHQQSRFEIILRERLSKHFAPAAVEKIMANLRHEISADINSSSLDDLERLAKQKLNISNE